MSSRAVTLVAAMTAAMILSLAGSMVFPGLLPRLQSEWSLSNTDAGWINGAFPPATASRCRSWSGLTDRLDARRIYLLSTALGALAMLGFIMAFLAPLAFGAVLDLAGGGPRPGTWHSRCWCCCP